MSFLERLSECNAVGICDLKSAYYQIPVREEDQKYLLFEVNGQLYKYTCVPFGLSQACIICQKLLGVLVHVARLDRPEKLYLHYSTFRNDGEIRGVCDKNRIQNFDQFFWD